MIEGDLTLGGEHTIQCTNVLQNFIPETYIILLANATLKNSNKILQNISEK